MGLRQKEGQETATGDVTGGQKLQQPMLHEPQIDIHVTGQIPALTVASGEMQAFWSLIQGQGFLERQKNSPHINVRLTRRLRAVQGGAEECQKQQRGPMSAAKRLGFFEKQGVVRALCH